MRITKKELQSRVSLWNDIQHRPVFIPPTDIKKVPFNDAVKKVLDWFNANFEDPVHATPYVSADGGYQYIWGGPYDARDIIESVFGDWLSDKIIEEAISELERDSFHWVPNSDRRIYPDDYKFSSEIFSQSEQDGTDKKIESIYDIMIERISNVEIRLDELESHRPIGIGHNMPPDDALVYSDISEIREACLTLKQQPPQPSDTSPAEEALGKLKSIVNRLTSKAGQLTDVFTTEAAKAAGSEFGKWAGRAMGAGMVFFLIDDLGKLIESATAWLSHFSLAW